MPDKPSENIKYSFVNIIEIKPRYKNCIKLEFHILLNIVLHIVWDPITVANKIDDLFFTLKCYKVYLIQALSLLQYWLKLRFLCYGCGERITRNMGWIYKRRSLSYGSSIVYSCLDIMYLLWNRNNTKQGCCMCISTTCPFQSFYQK